mmetsp:Transcript_43266/g.92584  ORF Transcript_43266/g.92584 Transcript_43266/m.92584 type:complete len:209 (-) Transcript_43266:246-872(-)
MCTVTGEDVPSSVENSALPIGPVAPFLPVHPCFFCDFPAVPHGPCFVLEVAARAPVRRNLVHSHWWQWRPVSPPPSRCAGKRQPSSLTLIRFLSDKAEVVHVIILTLLFRFLVLAQRPPPGSIGPAQQAPCEIVVSGSDHRVCCARCRCRFSRARTGARNLVPAEPTIPCREPCAPWGGSEGGLRVGGRPVLGRESGRPRGHLQSPRG